MILILVLSILSYSDATITCAVGIEGYNMSFVVKDVGWYSNNTEAQS